MRTISIPILKFEELSRKAKDKAKYEYQSSEGYLYADDALASLDALAERFDGEIKDWSIDWFNTSHSNIEFDMPELEDEEVLRRLNELGSYDKKTLKGHGDCVLTGYCADESAIDGFRQSFHAGERNLNSLMQAAFKTWLADAQSDCEAFYEDNTFAEHCDANNYEFYETGKMYLGKKTEAK